MKQIESNANAEKVVEFPEKRIDLESMTATLLAQPDDKYEMVPARPEDRINLAYQPENSDSVEFNISPYLQREGIYDLEVGLFGETWAFDHYGNTTALPQIHDIVDGLKLFFSEFIDE